MEFICSLIECKSLGRWECSCKENYKFCNSHFAIHMKKTKCTVRNIEEDIKLMKIKRSEDALDGLITKIIEKGEEMINAINLAIQANIIYIDEMKSRLQNFSANENLENVFKWTKSFDIKSRSTELFVSTINNILSIQDNQDLLEDEIKIENLIKPREKILKACEVIESFESQLHENSDLVNRLQEIIKRYDNNYVICKFKLAAFVKMPQIEKAKFLINSSFENFKEYFISNKDYNKIKSISITNDRKYIFVCNIHADCKHNIGNHQLDRIFYEVSSVYTGISY